MGLPKEILEKVKRLEIYGRKKVDSSFAANYRSVFRGQGLVFSDFREYVPGDDIRAISWPLTARAGKPFIKTFEEERDQTLMLALDVSGSCFFGTKGDLKSEVLNTVVALLGFAASFNQDSVGLALFSDHVEHFVKPTRKRNHIHRLLADLYLYKAQSQKTNISSVVDTLQNYLKKRSHIFLCSDFLDEGYEKKLEILGQKHDVVAVVVEDKGEVELPSLGLVEFQDQETGEIVVVDTSSFSFCRSYKNWVEKQKEKRQKNLKRCQVDVLNLTTDSDLIKDLLVFFEKRRRFR